MRKIEFCFVLMEHVELQERVLRRLQKCPPILILSSLQNNPLCQMELKAFENLRNKSRLFPYGSGYIYLLGSLA